MSGFKLIAVLAAVSFVITCHIFETKEEQAVYPVDDFIKVVYLDINNVEQVAGYSFVFAIDNSTTEK